MLDALVTEARLRWGLDPTAGLQLVASEWLVATPLEPTRPALLVPLAAWGPSGGPTGTPGGEGGASRPRPDPLPGRHGPGGNDPLAVLRRLYPADHPVGRLGQPEATTVGALDGADLGVPLYLAPLPAHVGVAGPWAMPALSHRLRGPDGCPWDREQTHASLRGHLLEEAFEVYDALGAGGGRSLAEELGDLLLQIVLHAQLAAEAGQFDLTDVYEAIGRKIVRRHPHVFGGTRVQTASDVNRQWERLKEAERMGEGEGRGRGALAGISASLPALAAAQEIQERAAHLGYDWPDVSGVVAKIEEELAELRQAVAGGDAGAREEELGDLLFSVVNLARHLGVPAEAALRGANEKFRRRFAEVEAEAARRGLTLGQLDLATLDALWEAAKDRLAAVGHRGGGEGRR
jgi:tetrapyrrole methylase family protein/MazG family protein